MCDAYPTSLTCAGRVPTCALCHTSTGAAPDWNPFGYAVMGALADGAGYDGSDAGFRAALPAALHRIEGDDDDDDGVSSLEELLLGTFPGDVDDVIRAPSPPQGPPNPVYAVGEWDPLFAFTRVAAAYCGASPTYEEKQAFRGLPRDAQRRSVHAKLDRCLRSEHWRNAELPSLADDRIRPVPRFEQWRWDYRLWRYANLPPCDVGDDACGDTAPRSARDLLRGTYHVRERVRGQLVRDPDNGAATATQACVDHSGCGFDEECGGGLCRVIGGGQPLQDESRRAGMVTTTWFHFVNTMFSALPRTTAAAAYRAYLGHDLARQEGLMAIPDEPADVDNKGVDGIGCQECHMHLDAAAYAFASYRGIEAGGASSYAADRPAARGLWGPTAEPRQAFFFDVPVNDLVDWATHAADSEAFARHHTLTFFRHAVGREPRAEELEELAGVWRALDDDSFQTPAMLHRLIDTRAFGAP